MLRINVNNGGAVAFSALEENSKQYDGVRVKHLDAKGNTWRSEFIQGADIITLLNIYTYAQNQGFTMDHIVTALMDTIDKLKGDQENMAKITITAEQAITNYQNDYFRIDDYKIVKGSDLLRYFDKNEYITFYQDDADYYDYYVEQ